MRAVFVLPMSGHPGAQRQTRLQPFRSPQYFECCLIVCWGRKDPSVQLRDTAMDLTQQTTCVPRMCVAYRNYEEPAFVRRTQRTFRTPPYQGCSVEYAVVK
jgi:hypothetical protein